MVYVIGDLHLSFGVCDKKMDVFGKAWEDHENKVKTNWLNTVKETDTVILAGDFSWAMNLKEVLADFKFIENLPGKKILLKGNHDYWWTTVNKMKEFLKENNLKTIDFLYNNAYLVEDLAICGSKGWSLLNPIEEFTNIRREVIRLQNSIIDMKAKLENAKENKYKKICVLHYPPLYTGWKKEVKNHFLNDGITTEQLQAKLDELDFEKVLKENNIQKCVFGHLHGIAHKEAITGLVDGIDYQLISGDYLDFKLYKLN